MRTSRRLPTNAEALADLVSSGTVPYEETRRSYVFECPKCGKPKLHMFKDDGRFTCWICKETEGFCGRPEYALSLLLGRDLGELRQVLYGVSPPAAASHVEFQLRDFWADDEEPDPDAYELAEVRWPHDFYPLDHRFSGKGVEYLASRGVSPELGRKYGLRYCPPQRRVIFPISHGGRLFGWQARATFATEVEDPETLEVYRAPKILTTSGLQKEYAFIFWDNLDGSPHAFLSEGPFDAIKGDLCGGNVGTGGKAVSRQQVGLIRNLGVSDVYLGLDPDACAETRRLLAEFSDLRTRVVEPPPHREDLGACTLEEVSAAFATAPRWTPANACVRLTFPGEVDFARARLRRAARAG